MRNLILYTFYVILFTFQFSVFNSPFSVVYRHCFRPFPEGRFHGVARVEVGGAGDGLSVVAGDAETAAQDVCGGEEGEFVGKVG